MSAFVTNPYIRIFEQELAFNIRLQQINLNSIAYKIVKDKMSAYSLYEKNF